MSWSYIFKLAITIFVAQVAIGFLDGFIAPGGAGTIWFFGSHAVSLGVCGAIFAFFASRQPFKPLAHAWIALLVHLVAGLAFSQAVRLWIGSAPPLPLVMIELLVVVSALIVGTFIGINLRQKNGSPADA